VTTKRLLQYLAIGVGAVLVLGVAVAAFVAMKAPLRLPTAAPSTLPCTPQPCANVRGFTLWVSDVKIEGELVGMRLTFKNSSNSTHVDPTEIQLIESSGRPNQRVTDVSGCAAWPRAEFDNGALFGPVDECFRPSSTGPPLRLHWEPDFGPFCCETEILLAK